MVPPHWINPGAMHAVHPSHNIYAPGSPFKLTDDKIYTISALHDVHVQSVGPHEQSPAPTRLLLLHVSDKDSPRATELFMLLGDFEAHFTDDPKNPQHIHWNWGKIKVISTD
jgi:hypothetical protein